MSGLELIVDNVRLRAALRAAPQRLATEMDLAISRSVKEMARTARRDAPKAHSHLVNAIRDEMISPFEGAVVAGVDYAKLVEDGTPAQPLPPEQPILDWIKVKHIQPNDPRMSQEDLAFVIARSIAAHGTPAQPYAGPALEKHRAATERRIDDAIDRALGLH